MLEYRDTERTGRVLLTFFGQWGDPAEGLALAREGLQIARRISSLSYGFLMVGNGVVCALRVGEWDWAADLLDEWIPEEGMLPNHSELFSDRAVLTALRGGDPSGDIASAARLRAEITDTQYASYEHWARAWAAFAAGDYAEAQRQAEAAADVTGYFHPLATPLAARAALWAGDLDCAGRALDRAGRLRLSRHRRRGGPGDHPRRHRRAGGAWSEGTGRLPGCAQGAGAGPRWRSTRRWRSPTWPRCFPSPNVTSRRCPPPWSGPGPRCERLGATPILERLDRTCDACAAEPRHDPHHPVPRADRAR